MMSKKKNGVAVAAMMQSCLGWMQAILAFPFFFVGTLIAGGPNAAVGFAVGYWAAFLHPELAPEMRSALVGITEHVKKSMSLEEE